MVNFIRSNPLIHRLIAYGKQSLVRNAGYLMGISLVNAGVGFLFWGAAAHFYRPDDVGFTSAFISATLLVCGLTDFGMSVGLVRYLPETPMPIKFLNTIFFIDVLTSVFGGVIYLAGISIWTPSLIAYQRNWVIIVGFLIYITFFTLGSLVNRAFIARRKSQYALLFNFISNSSRLILVILLVSLGSAGLIASLSISFILATSLSLIYLLPKIEPGYRLQPDFKWPILVTISSYSLGNYIAGLFSMVSHRLLPLLVFERLGSASAGHFYIAWMIGEFIASPNTALSDASFAEGSNSPERLNTHVIQSAKIGLGITVPAAIIVGLGSPYILMLFGPSYVQEASGLLRWLAMAAPLTVIAGLYSTNLRVKKQIKQLVLLSAIFAVVSLGITYNLIPQFGITAVGIGWFFGMIMMTIVAIIRWGWYRSIAGIFK